jgi:hypothetical protein
MRLTLVIVFGIMTSLSAAAGATDTFVTSDGVEAPTPSLDGLSCLDIISVLESIDASGYRGAFPAPRNPTDWPLFAYESRLSERLYSNCSAVTPLEVDTDSPFTKGFGAE